MNVLINTDGTKTPITPDGKSFSLKQLQSMVGGYIERIRLPGDHKHIFLVNEEGVLKNMPENEVASEMAGQYLVGPVVMIESKLFK